MMGDSEGYESIEEEAPPGGSPVGLACRPTLEPLVAHHEV